MKPTLQTGLCTVALCMLAMCAGSRISRAQQNVGLATDLLQMSEGKRVKLVWMFDNTAGGQHVMGGANVFRLMSYDTDTDDIEIVQNTLDDYTRPVINQDGTRIVYTDKLELKIYVVDWDGSNRQQVATGFASALWYDQNSGIEWVYYQEGNDGGNSSQPIKRIQLDPPRSAEMVWNDTQTNGHWLSVSADGTRVGGAWPWSKCGVLEPDYNAGGGGTIYYPDSTDRSYYTTGCWSQLTPDDTYRFGVFDGAHQGWFTWGWPVGSQGYLDLHTAPGIGDWEIYHPRLSNSPRFVVMTGPYSNGPMGDNNIYACGPQVEVYFGKIDTAFSSVTGWKKITDNNRADIYPYAWVDPQTAPQVRINSFAADPAVVFAGGSTTLSWATSEATEVRITPDIGVVGDSGSTQVTPDQETTYTVTAQGPGGPVTRQVTVRVVSVTLPLRLNCGDGSPSVTGWQDEDAFRSNGGEYDFPGTVDLNGQTDPAPENVYLTCVHLAHSYSFPLADGTYTVRLHFFDAHDSGGTTRAMDYSVEGQLLIDDLNVVAAAGGSSRALVREFTVVVSDGNGLQIVADPDQGNDSFESAIEILAGGAADDEDPTVTITSPGDGDDIFGTLNIEGTAQDNVGVSSVEVQIDDGAFQLASGTQNWSHAVPSSDLTDGSHTITVRATDAAGNSTTTTITVQVDNSQSITITSPAGGEVYQAGSTQYIDWSAHNLDNVMIHYSVDNGATYTQLAQTVFDAEAEWGHYPWTIPNAPTEQALVMVQGYFGEVPMVSNAFTIEGLPAHIEVTSPGDGDVLSGDSTVPVEFTASETDTVVLEYSLDGGQQFLPIATVHRGDGQWGQCPWVVPNVSSSIALLQLRTPSGNAQVQVGPLTIEPVAQPAGALQVSRVLLEGFAQTGATELLLGQQRFPVAGDGSFSAWVDIPSGVNNLVMELGYGEDNPYRRTVNISVSAAEPPIPGLSVSAAQLRSFFGGRGGVLVWVDEGGRIQKLDFRGAAPGVELLVNDADLINPLISADGSRLVYSQGRANGAKTIYIKDLALGAPVEVGRGDIGYWQNTDSSESIIYCEWSPKQDNGANANSYQQVIQTGTTELSGEAVLLHNRAMDGGPNGTLTWLGQVYNNLLAYDLENQVEYGTDKFFLLDGSAADHQTCNGSMAPDASARLMALVIPHDWVRVYSFDASRGEFWETSRFELPANMVEWEFPEWSTDPQYFTAVLRAADLRNRLFVVRFVDGVAVPEVLEVSGEAGATYSHLYVEPE